MVVPVVFSWFAQWRELVEMFIVVGAFPLSMMLLQPPAGASFHRAGCMWRFVPGLIPLYNLYLWVLFSQRSLPSPYLCCIAPLLHKGDTFASPMPRHCDFIACGT